MVVMVVAMVIWLFIWDFKKVCTLIRGRPLQFNGQPCALEMYYFAGTGANLIYICTKLLLVVVMMEVANMILN